MLLVLLGIVLFWKATHTPDRYKRLWLVYILLSLGIFLFHALSFVFLGLIVTILSFGFLLLKKITFRQFILLHFMHLAIFILFFVNGFVYSTSSNILPYLLQKSLPWFFDTFGKNSHLILLVVLEACFLIGLYMIYKFQNQCHKLVRRIWGLLARLAYRYPNLLRIVLLSVALFILLSQAYLEENLVLHFYGGSLGLVLLFQIGNLMFLALFLGGAIELVRRKIITGPFSFFLFSSISFLLIAIALLPLSFIFPLGARNWVLRAVNYWTIFAAPIAVCWLVWHVSRLNLNTRVRKYTLPFLLILLLTIGSFLSVVSSMKDPEIFPYETYWDNEDISAAEWIAIHSNPSMTFSVVNNHSDFSRYSKESVFSKLILIQTTFLDKEDSTNMKTSLSPTEKTSLNLIYNSQNYRIFLRNS
jgi:hypothetical protein